MPQAIIILLDTDVLIALIKSTRLDILGLLKDFEFAITEVNEAEVKAPPQARTLSAAIGRGTLHVRPLIDPEGLATFARLTRFVDPGEAATIAQASVLRARIAMHDSAGRRAAVPIMGSERIFRLEDIVVEAIREKAISVSDADTMAAALKAARDYEMRAASTGFRPLIADQRFGLR